MSNRWVLLGTDNQGRAVLELQSSWSGSKWDTESKHTVSDWAEAWQRLAASQSQSQPVQGTSDPSPTLAGVPFHRGLRERESVPLTPRCHVCGLNPAGYHTTPFCRECWTTLAYASQTARERSGGLNGA